MRSTFQESNEIKQILVKYHGFIDSMVPLLKMKEPYNHRMRTNKENFLTFVYEKNEKEDSIEMSKLAFRDFDNYFKII